MKIAILAWGSLAANPALQLDGPLLPIEFAWTSPQQGLILVLCGEPCVLDVRTPWVASKFDNFNRACHDLAVQEHIPDEEIGYVTLGVNGANDDRLNSLPDGDLRNEVLGRLRQWQRDHNFDAVIWRDSGANFLHGQTLHAARTNAAIHLQGLQGDAAAAAEAYIRGVPIQVWTAIRAHIALQLGWVPEPTVASIRTADDLRFKDWDQCRTIIGRLDGSLEDLRKYGFSLITGLLTAGAFLGFIPVQNVSAPAPDVHAAVFIAIMMLVAALFSVDTYYQVLLSGAVERALDLEAAMDPPIRVTKYLSINSTNSKASYIILFLYLVLLATAGGLGLLDTGGLNLGAWSTWGLNLSLWSTEALVWAVGLVMLLAALILAYRLWPTRPDWLMNFNKLLGICHPGNESAVGADLSCAPPIYRPKYAST